MKTNEEGEMKLNTHIQIKINSAFRINFLYLFKLSSQMTEVTEV